MMQANLWIAGRVFFGQGPSTDLAQLRALIKAARAGWNGREVRLFGKWYLSVENEALPGYYVGDAYPVDGFTTCEMGGAA